MAAIEMEPAGLERWPTITGQLRQRHGKAGGRLEARHREVRRVGALLYGIAEGLEAAAQILGQRREESLRIGQPAPDHPNAPRAREYAELVKAHFRGSMAPRHDRAHLSYRVEPVGFG